MGLGLFNIWIWPSNLAKNALAFHHAGSSSPRARGTHKLIIILHVIIIMTKKWWLQWKTVPNASSMISLATKDVASSSIVGVLTTHMGRKYILILLAPQKSEHLLFRLWTWNIGVAPFWFLGSWFFWSYKKESVLFINILRYRNKKMRMTTKKKTCLWNTINLHRSKKLSVVLCCLESAL